MTLVYDRPFHESFLERIVGVGWGGSGAVFVSGDLCCFERAVKIPKWDAEQDWKGLGPMEFSPGGGTEGSSYGLSSKGIPIFVIGGEGYPDFMQGRNVPIIMRSFDGFQWEFIQFQSSYPDIKAISDFVWDDDEKRFYANPTDNTGQASRAIYSPTGKEWFYAYGTFEEHCKGYFKATPDGVYGFNPASDTIIYPGSGALDGVPVLPRSGSPVVSIILNAHSKDRKEIVANTGLNRCSAVAFCGGIWMAGGYGILVDESGTTVAQGSATVSSLDDGQTWFLSTAGTIGMTGNYEIWTISGGPIKDFKQDLSKAYFEGAWHGA